MLHLEYADYIPYAADSAVLYFRNTIALKEKETGSTVVGGDIIILDFVIRTFYIRNARDI